MNMNEVTNKAPLLLAAIQGAKGGSLLDSELATVVGIADRDALRSILAVMAADGQITAKELGDGDAGFWVDLAKARQQDRLGTSPRRSTSDPQSEVGWVDGEAPLILRAAPKEARTLRDRITEALVSAGVDGLEEDTLHDVLIEDVALDVPCNLSEHMPDAYIQPTLDALIEAGIVAGVGCNHYALTTGEWARRTIAVIEETISRSKSEQFVFHDGVRPEIQAAIENLLAGTEPR